MRIVILGGGHTAWMAAAFLGQSLKASDGRPLAQLRVIDTPTSATPRTLSALPDLRRLHQRIGVNEAQLFTEARALPFYASLYEGFGPQPFWRGFGDYGARLNTAGFHHLLTWQALNGEAVSIDDYAPAVRMAQTGRFTPPVTAADSPLASVAHGLNLDAAAYTTLLQGAAPMVARSAGTPVALRRDDRGAVTAIQLGDGQRLEGDFFIDADGWLMTQLAVPFVAAGGLSHDRYLEVSAPHDDARAANRFRAVDGGWALRRSVVGEDRIRWVYDSHKLTPEQLRAGLGADFAAPQVLRQGRPERFWTGNVLALGDAAGLLDGVGLHELMLIRHGLTQFLTLFPDRDNAPALAQEYNRLMTQAFDRTADFARLHYPEPTQGWPDSVRQKIRYFQSRGHIYRCEEETASEADLLAVLWGRGLRPERYDRTIDALDGAVTRKRLEQMRNIINHEINRLPSFAVLRQQIEQAAIRK